jgi:tRNA U34 5-carboxymethylaminomethyl modifying enzyme MnmG/GidA
MWDVAIWLNFACWGVCFWWMYRLSLRQETMLRKLQKQAQRIEHLSKAEHDLLRELHPAVEEIQSNIEEVTTAVAEQMRSDPHS